MWFPDIEILVLKKPLKNNKFYIEILHDNKASIFDTLEEVKMVRDSFSKQLKENKLYPLFENFDELRRKIEILDWLSENWTKIKKLKYEK